MSPAFPKGLALTVCLGLAWLVSLISLLSLNIHYLGGWWIAVGILVRTQLQTGLFIIGHDAMHGVLWPGRSRWNDRLGTAVLMAYAALPYRSCRRKHHRHHQAPATAMDPDFPADGRSGLLPWYRQFMAGYLTVLQMSSLLGVWAALTVLFSGVTPTAALNVLVFCTLPLLLSSWQLFVFGTYLPHRGQRVPGQCPHPDSLDLPPWLSLLACFHFGYHREHHDNPGLAWFELPAAKERACTLTEI